MTRKPTHPGEVFLKDVLEPLDITITEAAQKLGVTRKTLSEFVNEKSSLSPEMAIRIAKATNTTPESWMLMQMKFTLWQAEQHEPENVKIACHLDLSSSNFLGADKMKKYLFFLTAIILSVIAISCDEKFTSTIVVENSSKAEKENYDDIITEIMVSEGTSENSIPCW